MHYQKILIATDFSAASEHALEYATSLARDSGATLLISHVEETPAPSVGGDLYFAQVDYPSPEVRRQLDKVVPTDIRVAFEHRLAHGTPADEILRIAEEDQADLIVIGTHGRTGLARVLMGSVAEAVMRRATCPVLTVKHAPKSAAGCQITTSAHPQTEAK